MQHAHALGREVVAAQDLIAHERRDRKHEAAAPRAIALALDARDDARVRAQAAPGVEPPAARKLALVGLEVGEAAAAVAVDVLLRSLAEAVHDVEGSQARERSLRETIEERDAQPAQDPGRLRQAVATDARVDARVARRADPVHLVAGVGEAHAEVVDLPLDAADERCPRMQQGDAHQARESGVGRGRRRRTRGERMGAPLAAIAPRPLGDPLLRPRIRLLREPAALAAQRRIAREIRAQDARTVAAREPRVQVARIGLELTERAHAPAPREAARRHERVEIEQGERAVAVRPAGCSA